MKGRRHTPEQVVRKLHEADKLVAEGKGLAVVLKALGVSEQTYYRWRKRTGSSAPTRPVVFVSSRPRTGD